MIVLQQLSGQHRGRRVEFTDGPVLLGRSPDAGLRFDPHADIDVSARHAVLERDGDRWTLRDAGSRNGTFVGGRRIRERVLHDRDEIELGHGGPRLHVTLVNEELSPIERADTEPGRSVFEPEVPSSSPPASLEGDATRVVSHDAETVVVSPDAATRLEVPVERPNAASEHPTRREIPRERSNRGTDDEAERARLEAELRRTRILLLVVVSLSIACVAALLLTR